MERLLATLAESTSPAAANMIAAAPRLGVVLLRRLDFFN
jgi:hypothetical protein